MEPVFEDEEFIRRYLLGELAEKESALIQDRLLTDREFFKRLLLLENELTDEYVSGSLSPQERERFNSCFLVAPERREKLRFARALKKYASDATVSDATLPFDNVAETTSWEKSFLTFVRSQNPFLAFSAIVLLLLAGGMWLGMETARLRNELEKLRTEQTISRQREHDLEQQLSGQQTRNEELTQQLEREWNYRARLEEKQIGRAREPQVDNGNRASGGIVSLALSPGLTRGAGQTDSIEIPRNTDRLRLNLIPEKTGYISYRAVLRTPEGKEVQVVENLKARQTREGQLVAVVFPAILLDTGDYILTLQGVVADDNHERAGTYIFKVLRI